MNKLLLLSLLGFALVALTGASEENGENSLTETESAIEEFETVELADAEAKRQRRKNKGNKKNARKNKNRKGEKKNKSKKNKGRKNKNRNGGKKKRKTKGNRNNKKTRRNKGKSVARAGTCDLGCLDAGIKIMKVIKDKITNYKRQAIRVTKQAKIGKGKGDKKGAFKSALDDLIDAGGGDEAKLMCAGNATNDGAKQMLNLTMTLNNCSDTIKMKCGNESFPTPPEEAVVVACIMSMTMINDMSVICLKKTGAQACACWGDGNFTKPLAAIKNCSLSEYSTAVAKAKQSCVKAFGTCRKYEDEVGKQIHTCNQDSGKLTKKLGTAKANGDAIEKVKKLTEALVAKVSARQTNRERRAIASCADFIKASKDLVEAITKNPTKDSGAKKLMAELEAFTGAGCSAADVAALNVVLAAADAGIAAVASIMDKLQAAMVALTGAPLAADALAAAAATGLDDGAGASTSGKMMRRLSIKNVLRHVAKSA